MSPSSCLPPDVASVVARGVRRLHRASGLPVAMGGVVARDRRSFVINELCGTETQSLLHLSVNAGEGLGGKALALMRSTTVLDYQNAHGITHKYDHAVAPEQLRTVAAIPIRVNDRPTAVVYAAARQPISLGDRFLRTVAPIVRTIERDIMVEQEVHRRLAAASTGDEPRQPSPPKHEVRDVYAELIAITNSINDEATRNKLQVLCGRVMALAPDEAGAAASRRNGTVTLAPREAEVLAQVAIGRTNNEIADQLGLLTNTVKAYLKSAMRKLGAGNRVQAVYLARQAGLIA
ncbi:MAG: response regulator transcription factor [Haloechinothrix sp.]